MTCSGPKCTNVRKLQLLKQACSKHAGSALGNWPLNNENYEPAWNSLVAKFHNPEAIRQQLLQSIHRMPKLEKETSEGIRRLVDTVDITLQQLRHKGEQVQYWDGLLVSVIRDALPMSTLRAWEAKRNPDEAQTYDALKAWLDVRTRVARLQEQVPTTSRDTQEPQRDQRNRGHDNRPNHGQTNRFGHGQQNKRSRWSNPRQDQPSGDRQGQKDDVSKKADEKDLPNNPFSQRGNDQGKKFTCYICDKGGHSMYQCDELKGLSAEEKRRVLLKKGVCISCGRKHEGPCPSPLLCKECDNAPHIRFVCSKRSEGVKGNKRSN